LNRLAIVAIAELSMHARLYRVVHMPNRAITECSVKAIKMVTSKPMEVGESFTVSHRGIACPSMHVQVITYQATMIIAEVEAC